MVGFFRQNETRIKSYCDHCGNLTFKTLVWNDIVNIDEKTAVERQLSKCEICENVILQQQTFDPRPIRRATGTDTPQQEPIMERLWPPSLSLAPEAPSRVRKIYEEARGVRHSPSSFVVQIGRALEAVVNDKSAVGRTLASKLNSLVDNGQIPQTFGEMAHINRIFRNWGAHDAEVDLIPDDVEIVDEFFRAIIEYLYVAPAKVNRVSKLVKKRQGS